MKVLVKEPGKLPEVREINNTLKDFQGVIDGNIETVPFEKGTLIVCDEEGKLKEKPLNFFYKSDIILGTAIITSPNFDYEAFESLTDSQVTAISEFFGGCLN